MKPNMEWASVNINNMTELRVAAMKAGKCPGCFDAPASENNFVSSRISSSVLAALCDECRKEWR